MDTLTTITASQPNTSAPKWHKFLHRVTGGDEDMARILQISVGATLAGARTQYVVYGETCSGKSVFVRAIQQHVLSPAGGAFWTTANHHSKMAHGGVSIPFSQEIAFEEMDPQLLQSLEAEADGIRAWAADGKAAWIGMGD